MTVTLYDAQTTSITVTQGSVTGTSNSFTVNPTTLDPSLVVTFDHNADGWHAVDGDYLGARRLRQRGERLHLGHGLRHFLWTV